MERHRIDPRLGEIVLQFPEAALQRVRLRRKREIHGGLGERVIRLRHTDEMRGLLRRARDDERLRVGETHVLAGEDDDAAGDEHRILARVDHAHEPVERGVRVRAAHALDEGRDGVVVLIAGAVVEERAPLQRLLDLLQADRSLPVGSWHGRVRRELERVECHACVAVAHRDQPVFGLLGERDGAAKTALLLEGAMNDETDIVLGQRLQGEDARP